MQTNIFCIQRKVCIILMLSTFIAHPGFAQRIEARDIQGLWKYGGGTVVEIRGNLRGQISARLIRPSLSLTEWTEREVKPGEVVFRVNFAGGRTYHGELTTFYPIRFKTLCPGQWKHKSPLRVTLSEDGSLLSGRWKQSYIFKDNPNYPDCYQKSGEWIPITFTRPLNYVYPCDCNEIRTINGRQDCQIYWNAQNTLAPGARTGRCGQQPDLQRYQPAWSRSVDFRRSERERLIAKYEHEYETRIMESLLQFGLSKKEARLHWAIRTVAKRRGETLLWEDFKAFEFSPWKAATYYNLMLNDVIRELNVSRGVDEFMAFQKPEGVPDRAPEARKNVKEWVIGEALDSGGAESLEHANNVGNWIHDRDVENAWTWGRKEEQLNARREYIWRWFSEQLTPELARSRNGRPQLYQEAFRISMEKYRRWKREELPGVLQWKKNLSFDIQTELRLPLKSRNLLTLDEAFPSFRERGHVILAE